MQSQSKYMLCYKEWVNFKKRSRPSAAEFAKQFENYQHRTKTSVQEFEQKPVKEKEQKMFIPNAPKTKKQVGSRRSSED